MQRARLRRWYLVTAAFIAAMTLADAALSVLNGTEPGEHVLALYGVVMGILVVAWLITDPAIPAAQRPSFDHGMLIWVSFPFLAAYQMYSAHRWRGIIMVVGLAGLLAVPYIVFAIAYVVG